MLLATIEMSTPKVLVLGAIAGLTIFLGLPIGRMRNPALQLRAVSDWVVMVACDPAARDRVAKAAPRILFGGPSRPHD